MNHLYALLLAVSAAVALGGCTVDKSQHVYNDFRYSGAAPHSLTNSQAGEWASETDASGNTAEGELSATGL